MYVCAVALSNLIISLDFLSYNGVGRLSTSSSIFFLLFYGSRIFFLLV
jgi:hypothetical protein